MMVYIWILVQNVQNTSNYCVWCFFTDGIEKLHIGLLRDAGSVNVQFAMASGAQNLSFAFKLFNLTALS